MPEMDGYEAARKIRDARTGTRNPSIPIIAFTADAISGDRDKCLAAGMSDYLAKPVEPRQLSEILEKWLNSIAAGGGSHEIGQSPANTEVIFNREELLARLMGDEKLAHMVVAGFLNDAPAQLRSLRQKIDKGDANGVRMQAHTLKGASATVSAEALSALCREVQDAAAAKDLIRAATLLRQLEEQFELLKTLPEHSGRT
jgi:two-component system, sensor histidine kinase and response regulator